LTGEIGLELRYPNGAVADTFILEEIESVPAVVTPLPSVATAAKSARVAVASGGATSAVSSDAVKSYSVESSERAVQSGARIATAALAAPPGQMAAVGFAPTHSAAGSVWLWLIALVGLFGAIAGILFYGGRAGEEAVVAEPELEGVTADDFEIIDRS
jgi:hypothetical protein